MTTAEFDLWGDEEEEELAFEEPAPPKPDFLELNPVPVEEQIAIPAFSKKALVRVKDGRIELFSRVDLRKHPAIDADLESVYGLEEDRQDDVYLYRASLGAVNAYVFRYVLRLIEVEVAPLDAKFLGEAANKLFPPTASLAPTGKHIEIAAPNVKTYTDLLKKVNAYPVQGGYRVGIGRVLDLEALTENSVTSLPKIQFNEDVLNLSRDPLPGFDGSLQSLKTIPIGALNVVSSNLQQWKHLKTNKKTLEEKFVDFGITNLHDLLFTLPKRFIDKSNPQEFDGLMEGEAVTIVGKIATVGDLPNGMGVFFVIEDANGNTIKTTFWRQQWLKSKFKPREEVLLTGKVTRFKGRIELGGSSIEHAEEAAVLPIVPIYKQSETRGVTTHLIMSATREFLARAGKIELPPYLRKDDRLEYTQALTELHFPTSLAMFRRACDDLAYYELVYMQLIMQEERAKSEDKAGLAITGGDRNLQGKLAKVLPFSLTNSQREGVKKLNRLLADANPTQTLLNADVGAGKTVTAQFACLKAVESGYQAVLLGPTEILARQLYATFLKLQQSLASVGEEVNIAFLGAGMKVKEKKPILAGIKDGSIDIVVGTTSVISGGIEYNNLGFICVDEQQKFGAEQRTRLLNSRPDGKVPDLLMMSATPIPRSTAQVFYGDMEMIELTEKPPGRLPIVTEWIMEDPIDFAHQIANKVWSDVQEEAAKGNQTFVITPMVQDSDKIDAASVERTYKSLSESTLKGLNVGFVHGRMKKEEQQEVMQAFRDKKYDVLVASTVVEVGVDVPDATRVVILSADRLGAASLHQIRGRVGRSDKASKCYLVSVGKTENSQIRLQSLVDSENGFDIALADLDVRGEGKMFGTEQSGSSEMIFASLARHREWIDQAKADAGKILTSSYRDQALADARSRFEATERLF